jgi:hypothetical protein
MKGIRKAASTPSTPMGSPVLTFIPNDSESSSILISNRKHRLANLFEMKTQKWCYDAVNKTVVEGMIA